MLFVMPPVTSLGAFKGSSSLLSLVRVFGILCLTQGYQPFLSALKALKVSTF